MTYKEALLSVLDGIKISDNTINKALLENGLDDGLDDYDPDADIEKVDRIAMVVLSYASTIKSFTEGGYSVTYDTDAIKSRLAYLNSKYGIEAVSKQPKIRARNLW